MHNFKIKTILRIFKGENGTCHQLWFNGCITSSQCCSENCFKGPDDNWEFGVCNPKANATVIADSIESVNETTSN